MLSTSHTAQDHFLPSTSSLQVSTDFHFPDAESIEQRAKLPVVILLTSESGTALPS